MYTQIVKLEGIAHGFTVMPPSELELLKRIDIAGRGERRDEAVKQYHFYCAALGSGRYPLMDLGTFINDDLGTCTSSIAAAIRSVARLHP